MLCPRNIPEEISKEPRCKFYANCLNFIARVPTPRGPTAGEINFSCVGCSRKELWPDVDWNESLKRDLNGCARLLIELFGETNDLLKSLKKELELYQKMKDSEGRFHNNQRRRG